MSANTLKKIKKDLHISDFKAQLKTKARIDAESDVRNMYTMIAMLYGCCKYLHPLRIGNWDATAFVVNNDENIRAIAIKKEEDGIPITIERNLETPLCIKLYHLHTAAGTVADPVFVIAFDELDPNECYKYEINNAGNTNSEDNKGIFYAVHSRGCNNAFFRSFATEIMIPFFDRTARKYEDILKYEDGSPMRAFVYCDGEPAQLKIFHDEDILHLLKEARIDLGKCPASTTAITQASDVSKFFMASKKVLHNIHNHKFWRDTNTILELELRQKMFENINFPVKLTSEQVCSRKK